MVHWNLKTAQVEPSKHNRPRSKSSTADLVGSRLLKGKRHFRIVLLGCTGSGKTCIISRLLYEKFIQHHLATVEDLHHGVFEINGVEVSIDFLDTSGSFEFPAMRKLSVMTGDGFILVFSLIDYKSWEMVEKIREEIMEEKKDPNTPILIIANKCDLYRKLIPSINNREERKNINNENKNLYCEKNNLNGESYKKNFDSFCGDEKCEDDKACEKKLITRKKSLVELLNGRRLSSIVNKTVEGNEKWREILTEMQKQRVNQTSYSNIEEAIEKLTSFFANCPTSDGHNGSSKPAYSNRCFVPRYSIATYNVYNKENDKMIEEDEKKLCKRTMSAVEANQQSIQLYNRRKHSFLISYKDSLKVSCEKEARLEKVDRKFSIGEEHNKTLKNHVYFDEPVLISTTEISKKETEKINHEEKNDFQAHDTKRKNSNTFSKELITHNDAEQFPNEAKNTLDYEKPGILVGGRRYSYQSSTSFTNRTVRVKVGESQAFCKSSTLRKSSADNYNTDKFSHLVYDYNEVINSEGRTRKESVCESVSEKSDDETFDDDSDAKEKIDKEVVESIVTMDWGHGFVAISAKIDEDISTCIFKALLSQVDMHLQQIKCLPAHTSSSRFTRLFLFSSRKQVSEDSKLRYRKNSCKVS